MGAVLSYIVEVFKLTAEWTYLFLKWFYLEVLPFVLMYIGIPLFVLGLLMGTAFSLGSFLFIILFFIAIYYFIKGTVFNNPF